MKRYIFVLIGLLLSASGFTHINYEDAKSWNIFTEDEYALALERSKAENKLVFIDFYATWCSPCKWMEETTLSDERIVELLKKKYITVKIDIDDFDGFEIKEQFDVKTLPTLIFLNSNGEMIKRFDETIGTEKFLDIITNQSANVKPVTFPSNISPQFANESSNNDFGTKEKKKPVTMKIEAIADHRKLKRQENKKLQKTNRNKILKSYENKKVGVKNTRIFKDYLCLQIGVYSSIENAELRLKDVNRMSKLPSEIIEDVINYKIVYRVVLGKFDSMNDAKRHKYKLQRKYKLKSVIR